MGGKTTSTTATKLDGISIQSSVLGVALAIGWGTARLSCNLAWYGAFTAIAHTTKQKAGKGLGGKSKNTTYTYTASIILGICEGPITAVTTVYKDKSIFTGASAMSQAGLSLAMGTLDQAPWGYLTTKFPSQAIGYSGIAYAYAADYDLGDSASLPNHGFEVVFPVKMAGLPDANPRDIVTDFLTNASYGVPGWAGGLIGDLSSYALYCQASNLLLSPVIDSQRQASDFLTEVTDASNSDPFWSEGLFKVTPRGDASVTGNGTTWTPNLTPIYDLSEDDFCPEDGSPAVTLSIEDQSDAYNVVQVEYLDRANQYNTAVQSSQDLDNIITYGRRKQDPTSWHSICDSSVAAIAAALLCQRTLYIRRQFAFRLPWDFALLEPTDKVTLTTATDGLKLTRQLVKIVQIDEDEDGLLSIIAEEMLVGPGGAALYAGHSGLGYQGNQDVAPGSVNAPVLINAPSSLTGANPEIWCAAASTSSTWGGCQVWISADGTSYTMVGQIDAPARYGVLSAALPAHADPDNVDTLSVNLAASMGTLLGGTAAELAAAATLSLVGNELVAYQNATLTSANAYGLSPLRRGLYGSAISAHAAGERFVRLDDAIFKFDYSGLNVGSTVYVKLPSFNIFGRAIEDLATVTAYTVTLAPPAMAAPSSSAWSLVGTSMQTPQGSVPVLEIAGGVDNPSASALVFQYRTVPILLSENGTPLFNENGQYELAEGSPGAWRSSGSDPISTTLKDIVVAPGAAYQVGIQNVVNGQTSSMLILGPVVAGSLGVSRGAYRITTQSVGQPFTTNSNGITISAFQGVLDDGRVINFPAGSVTGLSASSGFGLFFKLADGSYRATAAPSDAEMASSAYVFVSWAITSDAGGVYPSMGGGGSSGGGGSGSRPVNSSA